MKYMRTYMGVDWYRCPVCGEDTDDPCYCSACGYEEYAEDDED